MVWIAGNVATGIFAYPLFGLLAGIGLLVKLTGIPGLKKHNQHMREQIELLEKGIEATKGMFYRRQTFVSYYPGYEPIMDKVFCVSKDKAKEVLPRISQALANYTSQYRKIFNVMETIITNDQSEILIAFAVLIPGTQAKPFPGSL